MLKDLEQRGGWPSDTKFEPAKSESLGTKQEKSSQLTFLKISGVMILLYCAVYFWVKNPSILKEAPGNSAPQSTQGVVANQVAPVIQPNANAAIVNPQAENPIVENQAAPTPIETETHSDKNVTVDSNTNTEQIAAAPEIIEKNKKSIIGNAPVKLSQSQKKPVDVTPSAGLDADINENINQKITGLNTEKPVTALKKPKSPTPNNLGTANVGFSKQVRPEQKSANLYHQALANVQQGRVSEAQANLSQALEEYPDNQEARQTLAALLLDNKRINEAKNILSDGLVIAPDQVDFRMAVARLQVESGDKAGALNTLMEGITYARKNADYHAFLATMLQRAERHDEAVDQYNAALSLNASTPNVLIGQGISLQALGRFEEAQVAFTRAQSNAPLSADLAAFVDQRLKQVNQRLRTE